MFTAVSLNNYRFKKSIWLALLSVISIYLIIALLNDYFIFTDKFYINSFSSQYSLDGIEAFLNEKAKYWWLGYILTPILIALKISFTAVCISIGAVLSNIEFKFKTIFKAALIAEMVFIIAQVIYMINISFHLDTVTLQTASNYYPLTALSYLGTQHVVKWLQYPLQTLNLFEVFYMAAIAWLLARQWKQDFMESLAVVFPSYATGLVLWLTLVTFLTLQVS